MPNPKLETYKHKATGTVYDLTDAAAQSAISDIQDVIPDAASSINQLVTEAGLNNVLNYKADLQNGKVPSAQLPSFVDDVLEYASRSAFPATGETGKIYVTLDTNKTYRWSGSDYVEISESLALGETSSTAYAGNKGKANADAITAIQTALASKQNKTLDTPLTIDGESKTTVEAALAGLNDQFNKLGLSIVGGQLCITYEA